MELPEELKKYSLVIFIVIPVATISFTLGQLYKGNQDQDRDIQIVRKDLEHDIDKLETKIEKLEEKILKQ